MPRRTSVSSKDLFEVPSLQEYFKEEMEKARTMKGDMDTSASSHSTRSTVSFQERLDVIEIPTLDEYSESELEQMYYSREDQDEIIEDVVDAANGWIVEGQEEPRGLEIFSEEGQWQLYQRRQSVVRAVLDAQFRLRGASAEDADEILAECSYNLTINSQDQAYLRGYNDEVAGVPRRLRMEHSFQDVMGDITRKLFRSLSIRFGEQ